MSVDPFSSCPGERSTTVTVKGQLGHAEVAFSPTTTVAQLIEKVSGIFFETNKQLKIFDKWQQLDDKAVLSSLKIDHMLELRIPGPKVTVILHNGIRICIEFDPSMSADQLKERIFQQAPTWFPPEQQRLIHWGKDLGCDGVLKDFGVKDDDTIFLVGKIARKLNK